ncbi:MAG TPA: M48 family metallopeptidase [Cryomorphaceae bacterium]|nr:M48 family metallopeptidase [Cryomorphaceae bacterium]
MTKKIAALFLLGLMIYSCSKVPVSGRRQLNLLPESEMTAMSATAYSDFLSENPPLPETNPQAQQVKKVGVRISKSVEKYLKDNGYPKLTKSFDWSFHTVEDETINAWCMPGGRVVFYTGILPICQDEAGIAVVMGHEVAHAVAKHGNERMSQAVGIQAAGATLSILTEEEPQLTRQLLLQSYGIGTTLGSLAFSRTHESEADQMGLIFMAMAGYNPREAPEFWKRMSEQGGQKPPVLLSTHPHDEKRINDLEMHMEEALKYYNP